MRASRASSFVCEAFVYPAHIITTSTWRSRSDWEYAAAVGQLCLAMLSGKNSESERPPARRSGFPRKSAGRVRGRFAQPGVLL